MNNIYVNDPERTVSLEVPITPSSGTIDVTIWENGEQIYEVNTVEYADGVFSFTLPFAFCLFDRELEVNWRFDYVEDTRAYEYNNYTQVNIITPILPLSEINELLKEDEDLSREELISIERAVRLIIQAHTGQFFGKFIGTKSVTGGGESNMRLPARLISLDSINGNSYNNNSIAIRGNGWFIQSKTWGVPSIRADFDGWHENPYTSSAPIFAPYSKNLQIFNTNTEYRIAGTWGWLNVPEAVKEAARLLMNDYSCGDSVYRDRFLTSMTAADWRIQFHERAFSNTGNARANKLLADFVLQRAWVIV